MLPHAAFAMRAPLAISHHWPTQAALLFDEIASAGYPDVIALQEVTARFVELLKASELCRASGGGDGHGSNRSGFAPVQYYLVLEPGLGPLKPVVTALLTRVPPSSHHHYPFPEPDDDMDRGVLACVLDVSPRPGQGHTGSAGAVIVATTHLESPERNSDNYHTRRRQCEMLLVYVEALATQVGACAAVIAGDFNSTREDTEASMITPQWADVWHGLHGLAPGHTYDCAANDEAIEYTSRLDKILLLCPAGTGTAAGADGDGAATASLALGAVDGDGTNTTTAAAQDVCSAHAVSTVGACSGVSASAVRIVLVGTNSGLPSPQGAGDPNATPPPRKRKVHASDHFGLHATFQLA